MADDHIVFRVEVDPDEVDMVVEELANLLDSLECPRSHAIIAMTSMVIQTMNPDIEPDALHKAILDTTAYIATAATTNGMTTTESGELVADKSKMN